MIQWCGCRVSVGGSNKIDFEVVSQNVSNYSSSANRPQSFKQILQMSKFNTTPSGVPVRPVTSHESFINIHPDHTGLIIGRGGATIKKIQRDTGVDVLRMRKANVASDGMPWIQIRGHINAVESAYHRVLTIAQEAERRIPRMNVQTHHTPSYRHESHGTQPTFQHPFGGSRRTKKNPGPIKFPHPSTIPRGPRDDEYRPSSPSEPKIFKFEPHSPKFRPQSPEYRPQSPEYRPQSPEYRPQSPEYRPQSPEYRPQSPEYRPQSPKFRPQSPEYDPEQSSYRQLSPTINTTRSPQSPAPVKKTIKLKLKAKSDTDLQ